MLVFNKESGLTPGQIRGDEPIPKHEGANRLKYEWGKPLVWPQLVPYLPTRMHELHDWYMAASASGVTYVEITIDDQHYFRGRQTFAVEFDQFWFLFNQDAIDSGLIACWTL